MNKNNNKLMNSKPSQKKIRNKQITKLKLFMKKRNKQINYKMINNRIVSK